MNGQVIVVPDFRELDDCAAIKVENGIVVGRSVQKHGRIYPGQQRFGSHEPHLGSLLLKKRPAPLQLDGRRKRLADPRELGFFRYGVVPHRIGGRHPTEVHFQGKECPGKPISHGLFDLSDALLHWVGMRRIRGDVLQVAEKAVKVEIRKPMLLS